MSATEDHRAISAYYGQVLASRRDLRTDACCDLDAVAPALRDLARRIVPEVTERFYGCGSPIPPAIEGCTVLDLGCGTGRDAFLCSALAGPEGQVIGVDMTPEQLEVGRRNADEQARRFGLPRSNVRFVEGYIEDLEAVGIPDRSVDVVISNCVINLSPAKPRLFAEIFRVLRPGGELLFSDVFADRRLPEHLREDETLLGECLAGAMYFEDFRRLLAGLGVPDVRVVTSRPVAVGDPELEEKIGPARFTSMTVRAFRLDDLEDRCEDYGQVAIYRGGIPGHPHRFVLDDHHEFVAGKPEPVCGNTAAMLSATRFGRYFEVQGDRSRHFGLFDCAAPRTDGAAGGDGACC